MGVEVFAGGASISTGVALAMLESGPPTEHRSGAEMHLKPDGTYHLACGSTEMGNGITTAHKQIAAAIVGTRASDIDMVFVRENSEGEYSGVGGRVHQGHPEEVGIETAVFTRAGTERIIRFAFEQARARGRRSVTSITKSNAQGHSMTFWDRIFREVAAGFPEIQTSSQGTPVASFASGFRSGTRSTSTPSAVAE